MSQDRPSGLPPTPGPTDSWAEEYARVLADQLEGWALEREKVIDRLDVRAARVARSLVRSLRIVARALAASSANPEDPGRPEIMARLMELREDARRLMSEGSEPLDGAILRDLDGEPTSAQRDLFAGREPPITISPPTQSPPVGPARKKPKAS